MLQSYPIQVDGAFVGAAIRTDRGYRFVAVDVRVEPLDESTWPTLPDVQRLARHLYLTGRFPERRPLRLVAAGDSAPTPRAGSVAALRAARATLAASFCY